MGTRFDEVVVLIGSFATDQGESVEQELGRDAADAARLVFDACMKQLKSSPEGAALVRDVRGKRRQKEIGAAVIAQLESDRHFRKQIDRLMDEFDDATFRQMGMATGGIGQMGMATGGMVHMDDDSDVRGPMVGGTIVGATVDRIGGSDQVVASGQPPGPITIPPKPIPPKPRPR